MSDTEAKAIQTLDYTGTSSEYKELSEAQFKCINQIRELTRQAEQNLEKLEKLCPHLSIDCRWPMDEEMYTVCRYCSNHDWKNWSRTRLNSLYKNVTRTGGERVREAPR